MRRGLCLAAILVISLSATAAETVVDCASTIGKIRPLQGGNGGPIESGEMIDLSSYFRDIRLPLTRLHDCHWPNPDVVDIHVVFPNPNADPADPRSYNFSRTDDYVSAILKTGTQIVYRLGESIEHTKKKYHVHPPADPQRWADVCIGIIRHYNDGWAEGFQHKIRYWEIWNEPENRPAMWTGTDEQYFTLYETAARAIKARFPNVKVGGPSLGYTGQLKDGRFVAGEFLVAFLERCRQRSIPLDLFSWHLYTSDPRECLIRARGIRQALDSRGFQKTELHLNEWNYLPDNDWSPMMLKGQGQPRERWFGRIGSAEGAAFTAAVLINLQDSPVDVANYYTAVTGGFGMFTENGVPKKTFYAMKAFSRLLDTPDRLRITELPPPVAACAGIDPQRQEISILLANPGANSVEFPVRLDRLPWNGVNSAELTTIDQDHDLNKPAHIQIDPANSRLNLSLKGHSIILVTISKPR